MQLDQKQEVLSEAKKSLGECIELLNRSIPIESYSGKEGDQADLLLKFFQGNGIPSFIDIRGSVIALLMPMTVEKQTRFSSLDNSEKGAEYVRHVIDIARKEGIDILAYNAHMDVVGAGNIEKWHYPPFMATIVKDMIYGRGTCDMKGAMASMATAMAIGKRLASKYPVQRVILGCFVTEEESSEGLAFREIIRNQGMRPDAVLLGEPSMMQIARGQRGKLQFIIKGKGKRSHTSVPEAGENAAYKVARAILVIDEMDRKQFAMVGPDPASILKRSTLVASTFQTIPFDTSSVPDYAEANVTVRLAEGESFVTIAEKLKQHTGWPDVTMELLTYCGTSYTGHTTEWKLEHLAWQLPREHKFFQFLQKACQEVLLRTPPDKIWPFSTDGVFSAGEENIPTLGIGPGREEVAHIVDEYVSVKEIEEALALYTFLPFVQ